MAGLRRRHVSQGAVALLILSLAAASCGGATPESQAPGAPGSAPAASGDTASPGADSSTGPGGSPGTTGIVQAPISRPEDLTAWEDELVGSFATSSGLEAALGEGGWAFVEDQIRTTLADALERNGVALGPGLVASTSADLPATAAGGVAALGIVAATMMVREALANPSSPMSNLDANLDHTSERTVDGVRTVSHMSGRIATSIGSGRITGTVGYGIDIETFDAATGQSTGRMSFALTGTVDLELCPDVDGKVRGTVSMELSGGTPGAGSAQLDIDAEVVGTVNDAAFLTSIDGTGTTNDSSTSPSGAQRTSSTSGNISGPVQSNGTYDPAAMSGVLQVDAQTGEPLTQAEADERYARIGVAIAIAIWTLAEDAQAQWRNGACVEIRATESSRNVRPRQRVAFEARPFQKIEQRELSKPIEVTFAGESSVDPVDAALPSPVTLLYTASPTDDHSGTVSLKSTSNRGIGTLDITFTTEINGWMVDQASGGGRIEGQHCGDPPGDWVVDGTYDMGGMQGRQQWTISIDASGTGGTYTYFQVSQGRPSAPGVGTSPVTVTVRGDASGTVTLTIDDESHVHMHLKEQRHTYKAKSGRAWGKSTPLPLEEGDLEWEPDPSC